MNKKILSITVAFLFTLGFSFQGVSAQSSSGALSFSPASVNITDTAVTTLSVVYTGTPIAAAELHFVIPANIELTALRPGPNLIEIFKSTTTSEIHVGNLTTVIQSGSTLAYLDLQGVTCGTGGSILYNQTDTLIPDVTLTFTGATYTMNCSATTTGTRTSTPTGSITTLPRTDISDETFWNLLYASTFISAGIGVTYLFKNLLQKKEDEVV
jgi:hypothetical protein